MHLSRCCSAGWGVYSDTGKNSGGGGGDVSDFGAWFNFFRRSELLFPAIHDHCARVKEIIGKAGQKKWARDKGDAGYFGREGLTAVEVNPWVNDFEDFGSSAVIKLSRGIRGRRPAVLRFEMTEDKLRFDLGGGKTEMKQVEVFASKTGRKKASGDKGDAGYFGREGLTALRWTLAVRQFAV